MLTYTYYIQFFNLHIDTKGYKITNLEGLKEALLLQKHSDTVENLLCKYSDVKLQKLVSLINTLSVWKIQVDQMVSQSNT
jgi:hypothetical protein